MKRFVLSVIALAIPSFVLAHPPQQIKVQVAPDDVKVERQVIPGKVRIIQQEVKDPDTIIEKVTRTRTFQLQQVPVIRQQVLVEPVIRQQVLLQEVVPVIRQKVLLQQVRQIEVPVIQRVRIREVPVIERTRTIQRRAILPLRSSSYYSNYYGW
jgi:hypothetical protein